MKRFYKQVSVSQTDGASGWQVMLDGRGMKTVGGAPQVVPSEQLAQMLAEEWAAQGEKIDPSTFIFRDMADYAIDVIAPAPEALIDKLLAYGETDTLCYRGDPEDALFQRQSEVWDPLLARIEQADGVKFTRISGIIHKPQNEETLAKLRARIAAQSGFALAGLESMASLSASLTIALLAVEDGADAEALWQAACLEEEWQAELWGRDYEAEERREKRRTDFLNAHRFVIAARA